MSLSTSLQIGTSALNASQVAIQVAGNNLANAATPGYSRQVALLVPARSEVLGRAILGTGVRVGGVRRQVDEGLQARLWAGIAHHASVARRQALLSQIEDVLGTVGENDLSAELGEFFNAWAERATGSGSDTLVVERGRRLADAIRRLYADVQAQQAAVEREMAARVLAANELLAQVAALNQQIADAEAMGGQANTLRDQRDAALGELSRYMDVAVVEQAGGAVDVLVGSTPVVLGGRWRPLEIIRRTQDGASYAAVGLREDGQELGIRSGELGALLGERRGAAAEVLARLDRLASRLVYEVNHRHSLGAPPGGLRDTTGTLRVSLADRTRAISDPLNAAFASLPVRPTSGGFTVQVLGPGGATRTVRITVDFDGRTVAGGAGYEEDTTLEDIRAALDAVEGLTATITGDGRLRLEAQPGFAFSFTEDSSGVLAVLGLNAYFTGTSARDIEVAEALRATPARLATGRFGENGYQANATALALADLRATPLAALGGVTMGEFWVQTAQRVGAESASARSAADAADLVRANLEAQRAAISGVNVDEETVTLMLFQRQYQGAARFIAVVDELMQTLITLV